MAQILWSPVPVNMSIHLAGLKSLLGNPASGGTATLRMTKQLGTGLRGIPFLKKSGKVVGAPAARKSDEHFHDSNRVFGRQFSKSIVDTAWGRRNNLSGRGPLTVPLSMLCYKGAQNSSLRWLASGDYVSVMFGRNIKDTVLPYSQKIGAPKFSEHLNRFRLFGPSSVEAQQTFRAHARVEQPRRKGCPPGQCCQNFDGAAEGVCF